MSATALSILVARFFMGVCRVSCQAALVIIMVLLVQWLARRWLSARWRYNLWVLVLLRLVIPFSPESSLSVLNVIRSPVAPHTLKRIESFTARAVSPVVSMAVPLPSPLPAAVVAASLKPAPPATVPAGESAGQSAPVAAAPVPRAAVPPAAVPPPSRPFSWWLLAGWVWLGGVTIFAVYVGWTTFRLGRRVRRAAPVADPEILALLDRCRARMGVQTPVALRETLLVKSPALFRVFRPQLLLPPGLTRHFSLEELRYVFLHELAHVRRRDVAVNWLVTLLQAIHWFNPLVWLGFARLRADRELACDSLALSCSETGAARRYGLAIVKLLEGFARPSVSPGLVGILEGRQQMARRIRSIASFRPGKRGSWLAAGLMAVIAATGLTDAVRPTQARTPANATARPLRLRVVDAQTGQPIAGAGVATGYSRNVSFPAGRPPLLHTDANGTLVIPGGRDWGGFGVGVFASGYAPLGVCENAFVGKPKPVIPPEYTVKLERGEIIGGTLRDADGQPLSGVHVAIKGICDPRRSGEDPLPIEEYPFYDPTFNPGTVTDAAGHWSCPNFPGGIEVLQLDFQRTDGAFARFHTPLARWKYAAIGGKLIDLAAARRGELGCVFPRGTDVRGVVLDPAGRPLAGVKITETDRRHGLQPVSVSETGADGRFLLPGRDPHQLLLTLTGPGLAIRSEIVTVAPELPELALTMHPLAALRLRVINTDGQPVIGVKIRTVEPTLSWQGETGSDGRVSWEQAPAEPTVYNLNARGCAQRVLPLAAGGAEQTLAMYQGDAFGTLLHIKAADEAGQPLEIFTIALSKQTSGGRIDDFDPPTKIGEGRAGAGAVVAPLPLTNGREFRLWIESPGLEPFVSDPLSADLGDVDLSATLRKAGSTQSTLRLTNGQPAAGASVVTPDPALPDTHYIELLFLGENRPRVEREHKRTVVADAAGVVAMPPGAPDTLAIIVHEQGYRFIKLDELRRHAETSLLPWGRLEGTLTVNGQPKAGQSLSLSPASFPERVSLQYFVTTDRAGHFNFSKVPAGNYTMFCTKVSNGTWPQNHPIAVEIKAGETSRLAYGATGRLATGKLRVTPQDADLDWSKDVGNCLLSRQFPEGQFTGGEGPAYDDYIRQEDYHQANKRYFSGNGRAVGSRDTYQPEFASDGSFHVEGIPPGTYDWEVELRKSNLVDHQWRHTPLGAFKRTVVIPPVEAGGTDNPVELGSMEVAVDAAKLPERQTLAFAATTLDGSREVKLSDYRGKHVLITFWASWAAIPAEQLAEWKRQAEAAGSNGHLVLLGVSLDDQPQAAQKFVEANALPGMQVGMTGRAKATLTETLAVDELPTTLLIGPDGKLLARDLPPSRLRATIASVVPPPAK